MVQFCAHQLKSIRDWFLEWGQLARRGGGGGGGGDTLKLASQQRLGFDVG